MTEYKIRFTGQRFEDPGFPLECLSELSTLQSLVIESAKYVQSASAQNTPFSELKPQVEMRLTSIERGSVIPVFALPDQGVLPGISSFAEIVLDSMQEIISAIKTQPKAFQNYPPKLMSKVRELTATLDPTESIEFGVDSLSPISIDKSTISLLTEAMAEAQHLSLPVTLVGTISMLDRRKKFKLMSLGKTPIQGAFETEQLFDNFHEVLGDDEADTAVWVECVVTHRDMRSKTLKITDVIQTGILGKIENQNVQLLAHLIDSAISESLSLIMPNSEALDKACGFLDLITAAKIRYPACSLDADGGFSFDWSSSASASSLIFENTGNIIGIHRDFTTKVTHSEGAIAGPVFAIEFIRKFENAS